MDMSGKKTFITGPTGIGKTTSAKFLAAKHGVEYIDCDSEYKPAPMYPMIGFDVLTPKGCRNFLESLPRSCVVDNIPYDPTWKTFSKWADGRKDVQVFCRVLPKGKWLLRKTASGHPTTSKVWNLFWVETFSSLLQSVVYIDGEEDNEVTHSRAMDVIQMSEIIHNCLKSAPKWHDIKYQDIPEVNLKGYSGSAQSWENIKDLVDWKSSSVVDCGCFHGYMLFRASDAGCTKMVGLDFLNESLEIARAINRLRGDNVEFRKWDAGDTVPKADVTLCLNALHHFPDSTHPLAQHSSVKCSTEDFFKSINSPVTILEAYSSFEDEINSHWPSVESFPSARKDRMIYRCKK